MAKTLKLPALNERKKGKGPRGRPFPKGVSGNPAGKPKGPNKTTVEIRAVARALLEDPDYQAALKVRLALGTAGPVEPLLYHYGYGKPKDTLELTRPVPLVIDFVTPEDTTRRDDGD